MILSWIFDGNPATTGWCSVNNEEPCSNRNLRAGAVATSNATAAAMIMEGEEELFLLTNDPAEVARQLKKARCQSIATTLNLKLPLTALLKHMIYRPGTACGARDPSVVRLQRARLYGREC